MKKLTIFILISLFSNILSMEVDSNIDQDNIESSIFYLQSNMAMPILFEFESYVNQIKSSNNIFEFYKFFDQEKNTELLNMRLNGKLFNIVTADIYLKIINAKFEELKAKAIANCKNKSKEDLNKELQDILNLGMFLETEELKELFKLILAGADVNLKDTFGVTALMVAVFNDCNELVKLLLDKNAGVDIQNSNGWTALMYAAYGDHAEIVKLLLDKNAVIDVQNNNGWTALMFLTCGGYTELVKLLLDKNTNIDIKNENGDTALALAIKVGYNEIAHLLKNKKQLNFRI